MRNAIGIFGLVAGAIVVALVARYGYVTSDTALDGAITAFFFGVIAVGGIAGPAVAVHITRTMGAWSRLWGIAAGAIAIVALAANLSNSLGAIAGRADKTTAERAGAKTAVADARAELARLTKEREALPAFLPASEDDVAAARAAVTAAEKASAAECDKRGPRCREREAEEKAARESLVSILARRGLTARAGQIEASAAAERRRIETAPPVASVNPMAETLARVFHMQADDAATWQQVATVVVVELLIAFALIASELLAKTPIAATTEPQATIPSGGNVVTLAPGDVGKFATARLAPAPGRSIAVAELHAPYRDWCAAQGCRALGLEEFAAQFAALCKFAGVKMRGKTCLDLALVA